MKNKFRQAIVTNALIFTTLTILLCSTLFSATATETFTESDKIHRSGDRTQNKVSFMVNVYWGTEFVEPMLRIFEKYGFSTTFFVGGIWAEKNEKLMQQIYASGSELANHGYTHRDHAKLSVDENLKEIKMTEKIINSCNLPPTKLFAPPSGSFGKNMQLACQQLGYEVILWSRDTIDWRDKDSTLIFNRATKNLSGGDFVLMHPTAKTLEALPRILEFAKEKGFVATTVSSMLTTNLPQPPTTKTNF